MKNVCVMHCGPEPEEKEFYSTGSGGRGVFLCCMLGLSILLRFAALDFESGDYRKYLSEWYDYFVREGRWKGLATLPEAHPSYCYPPVYQYLVSLVTLLPLPKLYAIKAISLAGEVIAAWYVWRLARREFAGRAVPLVGLTVFVCLPTAIMNSALWGQCDILYAAAFLASLFYILEGRPIAALVAFGISCSLKPQAIFWCPFLAGLFVAGRIPWKWIWIPAAVYFVCGIPAMLAGRGIMDVLIHWGPRAVNQPRLTLSAPNWYQWMPSNYDDRDIHYEILYLTGVVCTVLATAALIVWMGQRLGTAQEAKSQRLVSFALLSVLLPPFFLPGIHERYFFAADVISVVYALYVRGSWAVPALVQFASAGSYFPYLFRDEPIPLWGLATAVAIAIALVIIRMDREVPRCCDREASAGLVSAQATGVIK